MLASPTFASRPEQARTHDLVVFPNASLPREVAPSGPLGRSAYNVDDVVAGKYKLVSTLGQGSMGEVWLAQHITLGESVALKLLRRSPWAEAGDESFHAEARFRFEAQVAARLSRKTRHIVQVTDHGEVGELAYLVMELLDGMTLESKLLRYDALSSSEARNLVSQVARALEHAHAENVLHRDLKPSNLFLTHDEDGKLLVKVLDFGIARFMHGQKVGAPFSTARDLVCGTAGYMSPEQARGQVDLDGRCDLWALATIAYEALTNELPIAGADVDELVKNACMARTIPVGQFRPELPAPIHAFFDRAFAENIDGRFGTAGELAQAFDRALDERAQSAHELGRETRHVPARGLASECHRQGVSRWRGWTRRRAIFGLVATLSIAALAGARWRSPYSPAMPPQATPMSPMLRPTVAAGEPFERPLRTDLEMQSAELSPAARDRIPAEPLSPHGAELPASNAKYSPSRDKQGDRPASSQRTSKMPSNAAANTLAPGATLAPTLRVVDRSAVL